MITVTGLTKHYGNRDRRRRPDLHRGRRPRHRLRRPERGRQVDHDADDGRAHPARPRRGPLRRRPLHRPPHPARLVGTVLDPRCMHPGHTARNHLRAMAATSDIPAARVDEVLSDVGLESAANQRTGGFSLGMRQRLALAGALLGDPQVLLLDEPSNGLDPDGIRWLRHHLTDFARRGGSVFVSSHLIGELSMFADDLVVVGGGRLLAAETVEAITARKRRPWSPRRPEPADLARVLAGPRRHRRGHGDRLTVRRRDQGAVSSSPSSTASASSSSARSPRRSRRPPRHDRRLRRVRLRLTPPDDHSTRSDPPPPLRTQGPDP
jgi:ABC-2 type transport system ATP-binding protein